MSMIDLRQEVTDAVRRAQLARTKLWAKRWMDKLGRDQKVPAMCRHTMIEFMIHLDEHNDLLLSLEVLQGDILNAGRGYQEELQVVYDAMIDECAIDLEPVEF